MDATTLDTDEAIAEAAEACTVFGRVTPDQKKRLLAAFDEAAAGLAAFGISRDALIARLRKGGNNHA